MAGYTDNLQALTSFTPYTQQQPVDAMVKVGMQKQQQYNEGIQKLQSQIDNVAGLDVSKDIHKEYLQSKLDELGKKIKTVAAGDFSNFQLVNSVAGMTSQIVKDPIVQNAVYSTQLIKKGQKELDAAKQSGKSSVQNEAYWNNEIAQWQNDGNLTSRFNGSYVPYTDVSKKLREVADKVHEQDSSIDIPYQRNADGSARLDENGNPMIDDAMLRIKIKGKPAEKILANFMSNLDENDQRQLHIDSWYHYRGANRDMIKNDIISNYNDKKRMMQDELVNSNIELQTNSKLTASQKAELEAKVNYLNSQLSNGTIEQSLQKELIALAASPDIEQYKYRTYTQKYLTNLAKDMSYESKQQEIMSNPYAQMDMQRKRLQFQYDNTARQQKNFEMRYGLDYQKWIAKQQGVFQEKFGATFPGALPIKANIATTVDLGNKIKGLEDTVKQLNATYAPRIDDPSIAKDPVSRQKYLDSLMEQFNTNPNFIDNLGPDMREYLGKRRNIEMELAYKNKLYKGAVEAGSVYDKDLDVAMSEESGIQTPEGTLSPRELYGIYNDFNNVGFEAAKKQSSQQATMLLNLGYSGLPAANEAARKAIIENHPEYINGKESYIANILLKNYSNPDSLNENEKAIVNKVKHLYNKYNPVNEQIINKKLDAENKYLEKYAPSDQPTVSTIIMDNKANKAAVENLIGYKFRQVEENKINEGFSRANITKFEKDKETKYVIERDNTTGGGNLYVMNGDNTETIPITPDELSSAFPEVARIDPYRSIFKHATFSEDKTTNTFGGTKGSNAVNANLMGASSFFPQLNNTKYAYRTRFDVEANPNNNGGPNDRFLLRMYVYDNGTWKTGILNNREYATRAGIQGIMEKIGPNTIEQFLEKNK